MHVVHFNSDKYSNMSSAIDKSDGLAVLGVLIEVRHCRVCCGGAVTCGYLWAELSNLMFSVQIGEFNPTFEQFLKFLNGIKYRGKFKAVFFL